MKGSLHELERLDSLGAPYAPDGLPHPLGVLEVVERLGLLRRGHEEGERRVVSVCEEDRARLATGRLDMADAVVLLVAPRELVALDGAVHVVVEGAGGDDAGLRAAVLGEAIEVVALVGVPHQGAVGGVLLENSPRGVVDVVCVHVVLRGKCGLRAVDGKKRAGMGGDVGRGLGAVEHVVGKRGEACGLVGVRSQAGEWHSAHMFSSK